MQETGLHAAENPQWAEAHALPGATSVALRPLAHWPSLASPVADINQILMSEPVDLKRLTEVVETRLDFGNRIVKLANSSLFGLAQPVSTLAQAAMVIPSELLRTLTLTCHLVEHAGKNLAKPAGVLFWRHALLVAAASQRISLCNGFAETELAYFAGLLHDIGWLPLLAEKAGEEGGEQNGMLLAASLEGRRTGRSLNHCVLGTAIGALWNFPPALVEIFGFHHEPERAPNYPDLARIVAMAEACAHLAASQSQDSPAESKGVQNTHRDAAPESTLLTLDSRLRANLMETLNAESRRIDQWFSPNFVK